MTRAIVPWSINAGQVTLPFVMAENVMYRDAKVKTQFAVNMHAVSAKVRVEYRITMVNTRNLNSTVVGPSLVLHVNFFVTSVSWERMVKPWGDSGTENRVISTDRFVASSMANANAWKV